MVFDNDVCYVRADADKIKMVITNLIDNAIKFTYDRGTITITTCPKKAAKCLYQFIIPVWEYRKNSKKLYLKDYTRWISPEV